jgi:chitinase
LPTDAEGYLALLQELRRQRPALELSAAVPIRPFEQDGQYLTDMSEYAAALDYLNLMVYDLSGSSTLTGSNAALHELPDNEQSEEQEELEDDTEQGGFDNSSENSPFEGYSAEAAVGIFTQLGFQRDQLVLGVPFYGKGWILADVSVFVLVD